MRKRKCNCSAYLFFFSFTPFSSCEQIIENKESRPKRMDRCTICLDALVESGKFKKRKKQTLSLVLFLPFFFFSGCDIVTIQCKHSFHGECLSKCLEISCPGGCMDEVALC